MLLFLYLSFQVKQNYSRRALLRLNRKTCQRPVSYNERKKYACDIILNTVLNPVKRMVDILLNNVVLFLG